MVTLAATGRWPRVTRDLEKVETRDAPVDHGQAGDELRIKYEADCKFDRPQRMMDFGKNDASCAFDPNWRIRRQNFDRSFQLWCQLLVIRRPFNAPIIFY